MLNNKGTGDILLEEMVLSFYKGNLNFCIKPVDVDIMDWDWQQKFLDVTVNSNIVKQYPVSSQFCRLFLKKIVQYLEPSHEIHDDLYTHICTAMEATGEQKFYYRHYIIGKDLNTIVTMKETRNMVVNGTTGLKTWEAALMLSDWALCNRDLFANKNILELGSGVGFAGITIGKMCDVKSLFLTDCHDEVLTTISENIQINFSNFKRKNINDVTLYEDGNKSIGVRMLDWNVIENLGDIVPDIIIGADIVYDPTILQPLCNILKTFSNKNKSLGIYIASVIRNEETFNGFLKTLDKMNFGHEDIELQRSVFIEWDTAVQKCLLKIKLL